MNDLTVIKTSIDEDSADLSALISELCTLLDRIEIEEDSELAIKRFDIFEKYGTVTIGPKVSMRLN